MTSIQFRLLTPNEIRAIIGISILVGLACLILAVAPLDGPNRGAAHLLIGLVIGTLFGQTTLAAAWTALGPGWIVARLPLALMWMAVLLLAFSVTGFTNRSHFFEVVGMLFVAMAVQWLCSQLPLWGMTLLFSLHLYPSTEPGFREPRRQFGILQLMIFTFIVALLLGIGRMLLAIEWGGGELPTFAFLGAAAVVMTLPMVFAAFLTRYAYIALAAAILFIIGVTAVELPALRASVGNRPGPDLTHLIWINLFTTLWVLAGIMILRWCGYRFGSWEQPAAPAWNEMTAKRSWEIELPAEPPR